MNFFNLYLQQLHNIQKKAKLILGVLAPAVSSRGVGPDDGQDVGGDHAVLQSLLDLLQLLGHAAPHLVGWGEVVGDLQKHH